MLFYCREVFRRPSPAAAVRAAAAVQQLAASQQQPAAFNSPVTRWKLRWKNDIFCRISEGTFRPRKTSILASVRPLGPCCFTAGRCFAGVRQQKAASRSRAAASSQPAASQQLLTALVTRWKLRWKNDIFVGFQKGRSGPEKRRFWHRFVL